MNGVRNFLSEHPSFLPLFLVVLIFISLLVFLGLQITSTPVRLLGKAADSGVVDPNTSSLWADQYSLKVGSVVTVRVFLHNSENRAVPGKSVKLNFTPVEIVQGDVPEAISDGNGQVNFSFVGKAPGSLHVKAVSGGVTLAKDLSIEFTK